MKALLRHRNQPGDHPGGGLRHALTGQLQRDVEETVRPDHDVVHSTELVDDLLLLRHLSVAHFEPAKLLAGKTADEEVVLPSRVLVAGVENDAARRDLRSVVNDWLLHSLPRAPGHALIDPHRDDPPAVVVSGLNDVDLVSALRPVFRLP